MACMLIFPNHLNHLKRLEKPCNTLKISVQKLDTFGQSSEIVWNHLTFLQKPSKIGLDYQYIIFQNGIKLFHYTNYVTLPHCHTVTRVFLPLQ